jgi:hypothetical protein
MAAVDDETRTLNDGDDPDLYTACLQPPRFDDGCLRLASAKPAPEYRPAAN